jgi:hypothetical protein
MQLIDLHDPLPKFQVAVKSRQVLVHAVDEPRVDRNWDIRTIQRALERRLVLPGLRIKRHLLYFRVHRGAESAAEAGQRSKERRHHLFAIGAVWQRPQIAEPCLIELHRAAVAQRDRRVRKIGVRKNIERTRWSGGQRADIGEQFLLAVAERVGLAADDVLEVEAIDLEPRLRRDEALDRGLANLQNLRLDKGGLRTERRAELGHFLPHPLMLAVARVLVGLHAGIDE